MLFSDLKIKKQGAALLVLAICLTLAPMTQTAAKEEQKPIVLKTMGSLFFGGTVTKTENGEAFHGDHGYAQYYIPQKSRNYPLIMWHGYGQSGRSFESTPDGREGYNAIFTRRDWPVYIIDQPRRGRAGNTQAVPSDPKALAALPESVVWDVFRNGISSPSEPTRLFPGVQFPGNPVAIDQFFRQQTPNTGEEPITPEYRAFMGETMAKLFDQTGPAILITHSNSGQYGWATGIAAKPGLVKAIVAYEPGAYVFPEGERPAEIPSRVELVNERMQPQMVPLEDFMKLTKMPILVIYGDNIAKEPTDSFATDNWRVAVVRAKQFVETINRHGGDAQLVVLPDIGIKGNTHAAFADMNNLEIAGLLEKFLHSKKLDGRDHPYVVPTQRTSKEAPVTLLSVKY